MDLQRLPADVQHERKAGFGQPSPHRVEFGVPRGTAAGGSVRHPCGRQSEFDDVLNLGGGQRRVLEWKRGHTHEATVAGAELGDATVVSGGAGVASFVGAGVEAHRSRERAEDELAVEPQLVQRLRALAGVECSERHVALRSGDEIVAHGHHGLNPVGRLSASGERELEAFGRSRPALDRHPWHQVPLGGGRMCGQEVWQLHDVAVGIEIGPALRVRHFVLPGRAIQRTVPADLMKAHRSTAGVVAPLEHAV